MNGMKNIFRFAILPSSFKADISVKITRLKGAKSYMTVVRILGELDEIMHNYFCLYYFLWPGRNSVSLRNNAYLWMPEDWVKGRIF